MQSIKAAKCVVQLPEQYFKIEYNSLVHIKPSNQPTSQSQVLKYTWHMLNITHCLVWLTHLVLCSQI
jgi:hypothetical protein